MSLRLGDVIVDTPGLTVIWGPERGLTWPEGTSRVTRRTTQPDLGVIHTTGGEGPGDDLRRIYRVLTARGYSCHFAIGSNGIVGQYLDPLLWAAAHCGGVNARSIGVEVENPMYPVSGGRPRSEGIVQVVGDTPGPYPGDYVVRQGKRLYYRKSGKKECIGLWPAQLQALRRLVRLISDHTAVPHWRAATRDYVPVADRGTLRGWLGHVQIGLKHGDPSLDSLDLF